VLRPDGLRVRLNVHATQDCRPFDSAQGRLWAKLGGPCGAEPRVYGALEVQCSNVAHPCLVSKDGTPSMGVAHANVI
jgi:hypothetical protein